MNGTAAAPRKRKYAGEKQPGGLVIVRAGPRAISAQPAIKPPPTSQATAKPPSSSQLKPVSRSVNDNSFTQSTSTSNPIQTNTNPNDRPLSRAASTQPQSARASSKQPQLGHRAPPQPPSSSSTSILVPTQPSHEYEQQRQPPQTPRQQNPVHARRSSMSARGKRASSSFENTGVVPYPHNTVADAAFYKHIDPELPEALRAQQLLIWAAGRAMSRLSSSVTSSHDQEGSTVKRQKTDKGKASTNGKDPPPAASEEEEEAVLAALRRVHEDVIRMLAEGRIDTRVSGASSRDVGGGAGKEKEGFRANDQNVKNRAREVRFKEHIERAKNEFDAWSRVDHFYTSYEAQTSADLDKRRASLLPPSAKARGKQRAASQEPPNSDEEWEWMLPRPEDMTLEFSKAIDLDLVRRVMSGGIAMATTSTKNQRGQRGHRPIGGVAERIQGLRFRADALWAHASAAAQTADKAQRELDLRFSLLGQALDRARAPHHQPQPADGSSSSLAGFANVSSSLRRSATDPGGGGTGAGPSSASSSQARSIAGGDPFELFRALSRVDGARPPAQMGDAARRAVRAVQRVQEGGGMGAGERRMVGVPPSTPRKGGLGGVGTPRSLRKSGARG